MNPESNRLEYKHQLTSSPEKGVIPFLNYRDGRIIYLGIDDKTVKPVSIENTDQIQLQVKDRIKNNITHQATDQASDQVAICYNTCIG